MFVPEQNDIVNANNTFDLPIGLVAGLLYFILCVSGSLRVLPVDFFSFDPMSFPEQDV